ncbi:RNA ligase family protein [Catellatospora bangladeshensis]
MIVKYPRTPHLAGSRLQPGDEDLAQVPFAQLRAARGRRGEAGRRERGHQLHRRRRAAPAVARALPDRGPRERQFAVLKSWAATVAPLLWPRLGERYVCYGEWMYAKHTVFYDALPHYFCEFDVLDTATGAFLDTPSRRQLLAGLPVTSVPVLAAGPFTRLEELTALVGPSRCRTPGWRDALVGAAAEAGVDPERAAAETDRADEMEGLYLKVEEDGRVVERYKWVRHGFLTAVLDSGSHWADRPIVANRLADPEVLYAGL